MQEVKDVKGERFGHLVVKSLTSKRARNGNALWECKCDCGSVILVRSDNLRNGHSTSCGCYRRN